MNLISVVLGADTKKNRTKDSIQILEYAFNNFYYVDLEEKIKDKFEKWRLENSVNIIKGKKEHVSVTLEKIEYKQYPIKEDEEQKIEIIISCEKEKNAPIYQFEQFGNIEAYVSGQCVIKSKIISTNNVYKKTMLDYFNQICYAYSTFL